MPSTTYTMQDKRSFWDRLRQFFCRHDGGRGVSCSSSGLSREEKCWFISYECGKCGFSYGCWIPAEKGTADDVMASKPHVIPPVQKVKKPANRQQTKGR